MPRKVFVPKKELYAGLRGWPRRLQGSAAGIHQGRNVNMSSLRNSPGGAFGNGELLDIADRAASSYGLKPLEDSICTLRSSPVGS